MHELIQTIVNGLETGFLYALIALGYDQLSMPPGGIGPVKQMVLSCDREAARRGVDGLLKGTEGSVRSQVETLARKLSVVI